MALSASCAFATTPEEEPFVLLRDYSSIEWTYGYMTDLGDGLAVDSLMGSSVNIGYTFKRTKSDSHSLSLGFGILYGTDKDSLLNFNPDLGSRGDINEKYTQQIVPIQFAYKYNRHLTDSLTAYMGARVGFYISKTERKTYRSTSAATEYTKILQNSISPTCGLSLGVDYKLTKNLFWNLGAHLDFVASLDRPTRYDEQVNSDGSFNYDTLDSSSNVTATFQTGFTYHF